MKFGQDSGALGQKEMEHQLRLAQHALRVAGIGTWEMDFRTRVFSCDERCRQLHGFPASGSIGYDDILGCVHPEDIPMVRATLRGAIENPANNAYDIRFRVLRNDGNLRHWLHGKGLVEHDASGKPLCITGTIQDITDLIEARRKASDAEQFAQLAIDAAGAGSYRLIAATGEFIYSPGLKRIFTGTPEGTLHYDDFIRYIHPEDLGHRERAHELAVRTGQLHYEIRVIWADGSIHWMRTTGTYEYDESGTPVALSGIMEDITEYKTARLAIEKSEQLSRTVFENSPVAKIITIGPELRIEALNKRMLEILGVGPVELLGRPLTEALPSLQSSNLSKLLLDVQESGTLVEVVEEAFQNLNPAAPGNSYFQHRHSPLRNESGNIYGVISTWIDVSREVALRQAEKGYQEALQASETLFRSVTNSAPTALWLSDGGGALVYVNKTFADWTGSEAAALRGDGWQSVINDAERESVVRHFREAIAGRRHFETEFRLRKHDGNLIWCRLAGDPYYQEGKFAGYAGFCMDIDALVSVRQQIEASQRQLLRSFKQAPVGIAMLRRQDQSFIMANDFYGWMVGRPPEDLVGKSLLDALPELAGQGFDKLLEEVVTTGKTCIRNEAPVDLRRNDKIERIYVNLTYQAQRDAEGAITGVLVVATDVTAMVHARQELQASEARFRSLVEEAPVATCLFVGPEMRVEVANEMMQKAWGKDASVIGKPLADAVPELAGQPFLDILDEVYRTGVPYVAQADKVLLEVDGVLGTYYYNFTYKPLFDEHGAVYGIIDMAMDVTEAVNARRRLEEAQAALLNAIDLAELGTWSLDIGTGRIHVSDRMLAWFGLTQEEALLGEAVEAIVKPDRARVTAAIAAACVPGAGIYSEEYAVINKRSRQQRLIHAQGKAILDSSGTPVRLEGTARDITLQREVQTALEQLVQQRTEELAAANEELQAMNEELLVTNEELAEANDRLVHSNEELAQYAYVASHDLQEPLRKIRVFSGMLDQSSQMSAGDRGLLTKISGSAERMSLLIRDLLEFSRLLNSESVMQLINLGDVAGAIRNDFELRILEKQARVEIGAMPVIEAVGLQMNQLFYNLIGNALKFVQPDTRPEIRVEATRISNGEALLHISKLLPGAVYYRISVSDNGIGFEQQYTEQIFEVFKRLHGRDIYPGSGIGLALCRRIVNNHLGALYAESAPGRGSVFHVILPDRHG